MSGMCKSNQGRIELPARARGGGRWGGGRGTPIKFW